MSCLKMLQKLDEKSNEIFTSRTLLLHLAAEVLFLLSLHWFCRPMRNHGHTRVYEKKGTGNGMKGFTSHYLSASSEQQTLPQQPEARRYGWRSFVRAGGRLGGISTLCDIGVVFHTCFPRGGRDPRSSPHSPSLKVKPVILVPLQNRKITRYKFCRKLEWFVPKITYRSFLFDWLRWDPTQGLH